MERPNWKSKNYENLGGVSRFSAFLEQDGDHDDESRWQRVKGHVRRHWMLYLMGSILVLLVSLLILFLAIIPAIVQNVVNSNTLPVYSAAFLNPTSDSIEMSLVSSIDTPASLTTSLKPLNLSLAGADGAPFTNLLLPETNLRGNTSIEVTKQTVSISNMTSFDEFLASYTYSTKFVMQVSGKTNTFIGAIKAPITLDKTIELAGLQNLTGFDLVDQKLLTTAEVDGTNFLGTAMIPNPSLVTFEIGNLTLLLTTSTISIGNATIQNFKLSPGLNSLPLRSTINLATIAANLQTITASQPAFATNGTLSIQATGQTTTFNGQRIGYYERVLAPLVLTVMVPVQKLVADSQAANAGTAALPDMAGNSTLGSNSVGNSTSATGSSINEPALNSTSMTPPTVPSAAPASKSATLPSSSAVAAPSSKASIRPTSSATTPQQTDLLEGLLSGLGVQL